MSRKRMRKDLMHLSSYSREYKTLWQKLRRCDENYYQRERIRDRAMQRARRWLKKHPGSKLPQFIADGIRNAVLLSRGLRGK